MFASTPIFTDVIAQDECVSFFLGSKEMKTVFKDKFVIELGMRIRC
jgi:hypothetical protein